MPDQKFDLNEREQGAVKMFAHIKKKILSSHSQRIQKVSQKLQRLNFPIGSISYVLRMHTNNFSITI